MKYSFENIYPLNLKTGFNKKNCIFKADGIHQTKKWCPLGGIRCSFKYNIHIRIVTVSTSKKKAMKKREQFPLDKKLASTKTLKNSEKYRLQLDVKIDSARNIK